MEPTRYGRIYAPDEAWLAQAAPEPVLDADLPIIDTHHHLWQRPDHRYLLPELLADLRERLVELDHLAQLDRSTVDTALRAMARQPGVRIIPIANTKSLRPRDHAAALRIGDEENHALWIGQA